MEEKETITRIRKEINSLLANTETEPFLYNNLIKALDIVDVICFQLGSDLN